MKTKTIVAAVAAVGAAAVATAQLAEVRAPWWPAIDTTKQPLFSEWYSDIPWHQKLGTYAGNEIHQAIVLPYDALGTKEKEFCASKGLHEPDCMLEAGVTNIVAVHRTDRLYEKTDTKIKNAKECQDQAMPCVEVKLEVSQFWNRSSSGTDIALVPRAFGVEPAAPDGSYGGFVFTDGSTYAPQMPWYMSHYCQAGFLAVGNPPAAPDVQDPACYSDYFSPMNSGFNAFGKGITDWPTSGAWSPFPQQLPAPPAPGNHCQGGLTSCQVALGGFNLRPIKSDITSSDFQYAKYNQFLLKWFQNAAKGFATDVTQAELQRHYPWNTVEVSWDRLYQEGLNNPFLGEFDYTQTAPANGTGCDTTMTGTTISNCFNTAIVRASMVYPRKCSLQDLASKDAAKLRLCGLNYEVHPNGFMEQFPTDWWQDFRVAGMYGNQYGRTSFIFAGIPGMQMPVAFYKDPTSESGLTLYEQVHNASLFSFYMPIANEGDAKQAIPGRNYQTDFFHTLLMSNHMESGPEQFADGIRGKVLWHNEYRTVKMYESFVKKIGNSEKRFPTKMFAASFDDSNPPSPFHGNTCDACHVRNGSGVPINTSMTLDPQLTKEFMQAGTYNPYPPIVQDRDYTFTGKIRPMKLVFFDLGRDTTRLDGSRYSEPLAFSPAMIANAPRTMGPGDHYYNSKVMNFYGDSFHVTRTGFDYKWKFDTAPTRQLVVATERRNAELGKSYPLWSVQVSGFATPYTTPTSCALVPPPTTKPWPTACADIDGSALDNAINTSKVVGFMLLNGKRLGNASAIEIIPNAKIKDFYKAQSAALGASIAGEIIWNAGSRDGVGGEVRECRTKSEANCFIGRFGWLGDRASLEDQVANAAFVEMNMTTKHGYHQLYPNDKVPFPIRYAFPNCGPANKQCVESKGNADLSERDVERMADYARWVGNPTRSEFTVALPEVIAGEKVFKRLKCDTCHVIQKIDIVDTNDTMTTKYFRDRMATHAKEGNQPFLSYLGTDLLMHDMGYLSQVGEPTDPKIVLRDPDTGVVKAEYKNYVQKIRTPPLKGLRFNRFATDSFRNTKTAATPSAPQDPACDFLMHDGRACDAIEAAFIHDGPAIKKLGVIQGLKDLSALEVLQLRAFLYSL